MHSCNGDELVAEFDAAIEKTMKANAGTEVHNQVLQAKFQYQLHLNGCRKCSDDPPQGKYWKPKAAWVDAATW